MTDPTRIELTHWHGDSAVYEREQPSPDAPALRTAIPYSGCGCREGGTRYPMKLIPSMTGTSVGARGPDEKVGHIAKPDNWRHALCDASIHGPASAQEESWFRGGCCKRCRRLIEALPGGTRCGNATYPAGSSPCRRCRAGDHGGHRG